MRALFFDKALELITDYPKPIPSDNEALIRVKAAGVCATDMEIIKGYMGFKGVPGHEFVGIVQDCKDATQIGKRVAGTINIGCNACALCHTGSSNHCPNRTVLGILGKDGAFADYLTLPLKNLHVLPDDITDEEAVFVEPLAAAFEIIEQVRIDGSTSVCVLGDGKLGLLIAQVLHLYAGRLIAVGRHNYKLDILNKRGIKTTLAADDLAREFDVTIDCTGSDSGLETAMKLTRPRGTIVLKTTVANRTAASLNLLNNIVIDEMSIIGSRCGPFAPAIKALADKTVDVIALVSRVFSLSDGIEAFEYARTQGQLKTLIRM